jgi:membrane-associated phospholipid phosphatase
MRNTFRSLRPVDLLVIVFAAVLSVILLVFSAGGSEAYIVVAINIIASIGILAISVAVSHRPNKIVQVIHDWYPVPTIFFMFKEVHVVLQALGRSDWDDLLIAVDYAVFQLHPTQWLQQFSFPLLTELLQIAYTSYYFIMLTVGIEVFLRHDREKFSYVLFAIVYGFFLSYIGYIVVPAVGPRFTLHDFYALDAELPGLALTTPIRDLLNTGESIPKGAVNALALAQRDAFPSGHTQMALISLYLAYQYRLRSRYVLYVFGTLLVISTVYLRYHYVVDLAGGALFTLFTIWTAPKLVAWWNSTTSR